MSDTTTPKNCIEKNALPHNPDHFSNSLDALYQECRLCPRDCGVNRLQGQKGYCGQSATLTAARAALHYWEEPVISGSQGSGTVFFSGCNLNCIFCQNHDISRGVAGQNISTGRLAEICLELEEKGAHNINLVTPGHFLPHIVKALELAKLQGLSIPVVYNTGSYELVSSLRMLEGLVDIYLPDLKYFSKELAAAYSHAEDYFTIATTAIAEMVRQIGEPILNPDGQLLQKGVIVRHLLLPGQTKDTKKILRYLHETYGERIYISIMNQYTPLPHVAGHPSLDRTVPDQDYERVLRFAEQIGITRGFIQEGGAVGESFIPAFNGEGL